MRRRKTDKKLVTIAGYLIPSASAEASQLLCVVFYYNSKQSSYKPRFLKLKIKMFYVSSFILFRK
jgi:hypothetical protein